MKNAIIILLFLVLTAHTLKDYKIGYAKNVDTRDHFVAFCDFSWGWQKPTILKSITKIGIECKDLKDMTNEVRYEITLVTGEQYMLHFSQDAIITDVTDKPKQLNKIPDTTHLMLEPLNTQKLEITSNALWGTFFVVQMR